MNIESDRRSKYEGMRELIIAQTSRTSQPGIQKGSHDPIQQKISKHHNKLIINKRN